MTKSRVSNKVMRPPAFVAVVAITLVSVLVLHTRPSESSSSSSVIINRGSTLAALTSATNNSNDNKFDSKRRTYSFLIDQSYHFNNDWNPKEISEALENQIRILLAPTDKVESGVAAEKDGQVSSEVEDEITNTLLIRLGIDVSNSIIQDEGLNTILDSLLLQSENAINDGVEGNGGLSTNDPNQNLNHETLDSMNSHARNDDVLVSVSLEARMNRLSAKGVAHFFQRIANLGNNTRCFVNTNYPVTTSQDSNAEGIDVNANTTLHDDGHGKQSTEPIQSHIPIKRIYFEYLDFGLNDIGLHGVDTYKKESDNALLFASVRNLVEGSNEQNSNCGCLRVLRMDYCGLGPPFCRAIGKGIINAAQNIRESEEEQIISTSTLYRPRLEELYLSGNTIGESGTTALAAALKVASRIPIKGNKINSNADFNEEDDDVSFSKYFPVLNTLDISSCDIADIGAEALALAIAGNPGCINILNLSNNKITDKGAVAIARALKLSCKKLKNTCAIDCIDLSNNVDIGDEGASALFDAIEYGAIRCLLLKSCSLRAKSAGKLGEVLGRMTSDNDASQETMIKTNDASSDNGTKEFTIDISGNKLGTNLGKKKAGYSAATMMNSMNSIGQKGFGFLKNGLKDIVDLGGSSLESDDEAEEEDGSIITADKVQVSDKCGAILMYDSFLDACENSEDDNKQGRSRIKINLGMRMCNFNDAALDAIGAMSSHSRLEYGNEIIIDCDMNHGTDPDLVQALKSTEIPSRNNMILEEMTARHIDALEARQRALDAKEAEARMNGFFEDENLYDDYDNDDDLEMNDFTFDFDQRNQQDDDYDPYDEY